MSSNGKTFPFQKPPAGVPIIGQTAEILVWYPTVMFFCNCARAKGEPERRPLLLAGLGATVQCPGCSKHYVITSLAHDARTGDGHITITQAVMQAQPPGDAPPAGDGQ